MRPETQLQRTLVRYLTVKGYRSVAIPNGAVLRGDKMDRARQMANLKRDGLTPGFPDLIVYGTDGRVGHIEVKIEGRYQSASQKDCERWLTELGQKVAVCRSIEDIDETLQQWGWQ
ncbi:VRR-NUC domain-containing protein [Novosphingobium sp. JCM 18896]|uniref:VRR-NUC domain-containing protein n=1 Tax=Novosphingobium sp. JCM 18896 TaxID=2989731 RepID=UPI00222242B9|nr:VRR-NUC domain-containing protein [Novosphingobium sp. JCM 18896]MCW1431379.1 VRR-NUC domain-containing protein [Novosphingobium sp. JCM 18896]